MFVQQMSTVRKDPKLLLSMPPDETQRLRTASSHELSQKIEELKSSYMAQKKAF